MVSASLSHGLLLRRFDYIRLIQVVQGGALLTLVLNLVALWKQEARTPRSAESDEPAPAFSDTFRAFLKGGDSSRLLVAVGLGGAGFNMQDILLEPYGGEILKLPVAATTSLTALLAGGTLLGLFVAARWLSRGRDPNQLGALGALVGIGGLSAVIFSAPLASLPLFLFGTSCIGFGGGWFSVGTLTSAMALADRERALDSGAPQSGLAIGAWGAVHATVSGGGIALGGAVRDLLGGLASRGALGPGLSSPSVGYSFVYHLEIALLFGTLVALGPLVRIGERPRNTARLGLAEMPG
jgi:BCD family chlorophyll transporter-like MFS transporter